MRWLSRAYFAIVGFVGLSTGGVLLSAPGTTANYFAWPIAPSLTAVFMGAGYLGTGITMLIGLNFAHTWREARLIVPPIMIFATTMILATLLHADRFIWDRAITWLWLGLYVLIVVGGLIVWQIERNGAPTESTIPQTRMERRALILVGLATSAWALPLFIVPTVAGSLWPWLLTPLTARIIAGWVGVAAALALVAARANDIVALRLPLLGWTITVVLFLAASALHASEFAPADVRTLMYVVALGLSVAGSVWLLVRVQQRQPQVA